MSSIWSSYMPALAEFSTSRYVSGEGNKPSLLDQLNQILVTTLKVRLSECRTLRGV